MSRRVDNIDFYVLIKNSGIFGKDGNSAFALDVAGVHNAFPDLLVFAEYAALF